jgi:ribonuclease D
LKYALNDVLYLHVIYLELLRIIIREELLSIFKACMNAIAYLALPMGHGHSYVRLIDWK